MELPLLYRLVLWCVLAAAPLTALTLVFVTAPYGRHERPGWGPRVSNRWGWRLMEGTSLAVFLVSFASGVAAREVVPLMFCGAWSIHYVYRAVVYPQMMRPRPRSMPLVIAVSGMAFNLMNAWLNARWVAHFGVYPSSWALGFRFILGMLLMLGGFLLHVHSDLILMRLRKPGEVAYRIPQRGLHRWVCNPNYLGEIIEWSGWALATWSPAGLAFALFTVANLVPRALANLRWYRSTFAEYPPERRALVPGLF